MKIRKLVIIIFFCVINIYSQPAWFIQNSGTTQNINSIYILNYNLGFAACNGGLLLKTGNGGNSWNLLYTFNSDVKRVRFFDHLTGFVFTNDGIYKTTDGGNNWIQLNNTSGVLDFSYANEYNMMASYSNGSILRSTDGGMHWGVIYPLNSVSPGVCSMESYSGFAAISNIIGNTSYHNIYKTTNGGSQWSLFCQATTLQGTGRTGDLFFINQDTGYYSVKLNNNNFIYSFNGTNWNQRSVNNFQNCLFFNNAKTGWSAGEGGSIYKTTNAGNNWYQSTTPGTANLTGIQFANDLTGWASGENGLILKTTNGGITGFSQITSEIPEKFSLSQNYPNPFNPVTKIKFQISLSGGVSEGRGVFTKLTIYDALGKEVLVLVNQDLQPGKYEVDFDGSNLPSGVYYYKLESSKFTETKKMLMIK